LGESVVRLGHHLVHPRYAHKFTVLSTMQKAHILLFLATSLGEKA